MKTLITLHLPPPKNTFEYVKTLPWLNNLTLDENFGLVLISPKHDLYTICVKGKIDSKKLKSDYSDIIKGIHGDAKISPFSNEL